MKAAKDYIWQVLAVLGLVLKSRKFVAVAIGALSVLLAKMNLRPEVADAVVKIIQWGITTYVAATSVEDFAKHLSPDTQAIVDKVLGALVDASEPSPDSTASQPKENKPDTSSGG